ncbi:MAG: undecaprenyl/decaprenyl-phosphate alpha-N-acetylglucosaminyl 1-phosphate transferase [Candidatus Hydrogenedentes bacterium]|nr:undecaprenyl/decaprenyl-phosphate alpha-N-acetylglucosaminyl 1-phosphate transferase [Candidatus Hydrogenedentota bacterium]
MLQGLPYWPRTYILVGCVAFIVATFTMPFLIHLLRRARILDEVAPNKIHDRPIPRGGGIIIFLAFAIAVLLPNYRDNPMKGVLLGSGICLFVGAVDDIQGGIPAYIKFLTLLCVTLIMSHYGVLLRVFQYYPLDLALTLFWVVGVTSAFNGIDNMDGLASGVATIVSVMYLVIALQAFFSAGTETSLAWFGLLAAGLIGANLGFLVFNFNPARVFMGDSGSFFLGFTLAALGVMGEWSQTPIISLSIPILILGVPIFDFAYIIIARIVRGETRTLHDVIAHCAPDHLSHRLVWIGFSQRKAVLFIYLISASMGVSGILLRNSSSLLDMMLALFQGLAIVCIVIVLMATAARRHQAHIDAEVAKLRPVAVGEDPPDSPGDGTE